MIKSIRWIGVEVKNPPIYDVTNGLDNFLHKMESLVVDKYQMEFMDIVLRGTSIRWWVTHKDDLPDSNTTYLALLIRFKPSMQSE